MQKIHWYLFHQFTSFDGYERNSPESHNRDRGHKVIGITKRKTKAPKVLALLVPLSFFIIEIG